MKIHDEDEQPGIPEEPPGAHLALDWSLVVNSQPTQSPTEPKPSRTEPKTDPRRAKLGHVYPVNRWHPIKGTLQGDSIWLGGARFLGRFGSVLARRARCWLGNG